MTIDNSLLKHPIFSCADDMATICKPLQRFNITYFSHVKINNKGEFAALAIDPKYAETYFSKKFYNSHMTSNIGDYVLWDALSFTKKTAEVRKESSQLGLCHSFSIIEKSKDGNDFYHFSCNIPNYFLINQFYISNIDLLKTFIEYFNNTVKQSRELLKAYDYKFHVSKNAAGFEIDESKRLLNVLNNRALFLRDIAEQNDSKNKIITNTDIASSITAQQLKCLSLLASGKSAKEIARILNLSPRTVDHYLQHLRNRLKCKNSKELISLYYGVLRSA